MPEFEITSPDYFPMWAAAAKSPWNYGLMIDESAPLDRQVHTDSHPASSDPWSNPSLSLKVRARRIYGWDLVPSKGDDPEGFMTPALPQDKSRLGPEEQIFFASQTASSRHRCRVSKISLS